MTIVNDSDREKDETFYVYLYNAQGAEFEGPPNQNDSLLAEVTIVDND